MQETLRLVLRNVAFHRHQAVLGHQLGNRLIVASGKPYVAVCQNADELAFTGAAVRRFGCAVDDGHARDSLFRHQLQSVSQGFAWGDGDRIENDAAFVSFDLCDVTRLLIDRKVAMQNADATFLRHRNGEAGFGDRVHGRRQQRDIEPHRLRELRRDVHLARHHIGRTGHEQNVVEGKRNARIERR